LNQGQYIGFSDNVDGTESKVQGIIPAAGTVKNLYVLAQQGPGTGNSWTMTVRRNSNDTSVTCTISGTSTTCSDTSHTAVFAAGDLFSISVTGSGGAKPGVWSAVFGP
jgi:hypothetical protein